VCSEQYLQFNAGAGAWWPWLEHVAVVEGHHMSTESSDFPSRLRAHVELQGAILTPEELSHVGECYPRCRGKDHWDVREYASVTGIGAREYRVVRGTSTLDVYRTTERDHASAVRSALNELESQDIRTEKPSQNSSS
jgi:hypothetical protein